MNAPAWTARYVGIPFADNGFTREGCNCWGLVHMVLKAECGIETPTYAEISATQMLATCRAMRAGAQSEIWPVAPRPFRAFDVVLMRAMTDDGLRTDGHVGILIASDRVLHVWRATSAIIMPLDHSRVRVVSVHRHRELM